MQLSLNNLPIIYYFNSKTIYRQQSWFWTNPRLKFHHFLSAFQEMGNVAGMRNLRGIIFLLQAWPAKMLLILDSLISNLSRYPDVWKYFSIHNTLNLGIQGNKIQNILWWLNNLNFSKNYSVKYVFILGGTKNVDHNSAKEIVNGLITSGFSAQAQCQNAKVLVIPILTHNIKNSLRWENINVINTLLLSKCLKHNLYIFKHEPEWLNSDRSLNMFLFYKDGLHWIKNEN